MDIIDVPDELCHFQWIPSKLHVLYSNDVSRCRPSLFDWHNSRLLFISMFGVASPALRMHCITCAPYKIFRVFDVNYGCFHWAIVWQANIKSSPYLFVGGCRPARLPWPYSGPKRHGLHHMWCGWRRRVHRVIQNTVLYWTIYQFYVVRLFARFA